MRVERWKTRALLASGLALAMAVGLACGSSSEATAQAKAREYTSRFYDGDLTGLHRLFTPDMAQQIPFAEFTEMKRLIAEQLGGETEVLSESVEFNPPYYRYLRRARFELYAGEIEVTWLLRDDHSIAGVAFGPAQTPGPG